MTLVRGTTKRMMQWLCLCGLFGFLSVPVHARVSDCTVTAARHHGVNSWVLAAILWQESRWKADAIRNNDNGTVDHGIAQINSIHLKELKAYGLTAKDLMDGCTGTFVAAWHLRKQIDRYGNNWFAVGAYHSVTPTFNSRYSRSVCMTVSHWRKLQGTVDASKNCPAAIDDDKRRVAGSQASSTSENSAVPSRQKSRDWDQEIKRKSGF